MRPLMLAALCAPLALAQPRDGGSAPAKKPAELSASDCDKLEDHIILLSVDEALANDPEVKKMSAKEREVTEKLARRQALADPKLAELKQACPARYDKQTEQCILKAKTLKDVDACAREPARHVR
ncbi:MAG: hypothetical protein INH41_30550 [Myxococcaceae bacterium]|nr:hypothetical protein [Myxococcaceae bacterium]MCA3016746.1 hypothetical protein [Myxococcaceae bacterium]